MELEPNSPTRGKEKTVGKKALLSSADKRKIDRSSVDRRQLKGKAKVVSVEPDQPSTSGVKECRQFSLHPETDVGQRKMIFMITCASEGQIVDVIVDGGSCENMVLENLVKQLRLRRYKVRTPYRMSWFRKGGEISVKYRCLVLLQLKDYKDKVWCDVVPMDACHILLGRLWQYDRQAIHDGR
eukprot:Gb_06946 [translate_table: standard]